MWEYELYSNYRKEQNRIASEWFKSKEYPVDKKYSYILRSKNDWRNNIILTEVADYIEDVKIESNKNKNPFPIHKYIHHGCSSQAMLFNLLGDVIRKKEYKFLSKIFDYDDVVIDEKSDMSFEYSDRNTFNEQQQQPTSFDLAITNKQGKNIFIEAKYIETEFGGCSAIENGECEGINPVNNENLCYLTCKGKGRKYWELMKKYGLDTIFADSKICPFTIYYQFYRELMFSLENNGYFVILVDKRNPAFVKNGVSDKNKRGLIPTLLEFVPENYRKYIKVIYIQDILDNLDRFGYKWVSEFRAKYGIKNKDTHQQNDFASDEV
jgi:hypothetical protein